MRIHNWTVEVIDGGHLGIGEFWICKDCGASGGSTVNDKRPTRCFYAGTGLDLDEDCSVSKKMIDAYELGFARCLARIPPKIQKKFSLGNK